MTEVLVRQEEGKGALSEMGVRTTGRFRLGRGDRSSGEEGNVIGPNIR